MRGRRRLAGDAAGRADGAASVSGIATGGTASATTVVTAMPARLAWYASDESLPLTALHAEKFRGIRPAFGYPACPDHTEKGKLFELLGAGDVDMKLTSHFAMSPAASVSGIYLGHPSARYFTLGRVDRDQVRDYARRKGMGMSEMERWLAPNLAYEPDEA